jgi:hypothetical protein
MKWQTANEAPSTPRPAESWLKEAASASSRMSRHLVSAIPWRKRVKHNATPWRESNKERLTSKIHEISYWNQVLYSLLPSDLKESILRQGISSFVLADLEEAAPISQLGEGVISQQAKLCEANKKLAENTCLTSFTEEVLRQRLINLDVFDMSSVAEQDTFSLVRYKYSQGGKRP